MKDSWRHNLILCFLYCNAFRMAFADVNDERSGLTSTRESRKLFGGYRITPRFCKPTRISPGLSDGPTICMFNHECTQRNGVVVGACMDGFLFGACCQLPEDTSVGGFLTQDYPGVTGLDNSLVSKISQTTHRTTPLYNIDITSQGVSQIAASLLGGNPPFSGGSSVLPTGIENSVSSEPNNNNWMTTAAMHSSPDTVIDDDDNGIKSTHFSSTSSSTFGNKMSSTHGNEQTTTRYSDTYPPAILEISVSNAPLGYTPIPTIQKPMFRPKPPKPTDENYILIPTLSHDSTKSNQTKDSEPQLDSVSLLTPPSTHRPISTLSYGSSSSALPITSRKPPSTSYVFSTTIPPRRTQPTTAIKKPSQKRKPTKSTTRKPPSTSYVYNSTPTFRPGTVEPVEKPSSIVTPRPKPLSSSPTFKPTKAPKPPSTSYVYSSTFRPITSAHSTFANSPEAFPGAQSTPTYQQISGSSSYRPSTISTNIAGPGFTVTSQPIGQSSSFPSPAPTLIVLGPVSDNENEDTYVIASTEPSKPPTKIESATTTVKPSQLSPYPQRKPVNHVTINNHVTQNIYSTQRPPSSSSPNAPSPTVIITPKPTISSSSPLPLPEEDLESVVVTSASDLINFPPDRNPNLNISHPVLSDDDITTPTFVEDDTMNEKVESFVNEIIYGLQEPFNDLKDIVYNKHFNGTPTASVPSVTTKKPIKKQGTTTKKPVVKPGTIKTTTRRPATTRKPVTSGIPAKVTTTTTTRRPTTTKRIPTTIPNFVEIDTETELHQNYRDQCGVRPLVKSGRIVGGRGAIFGEFPWQVLVRESTWLGLFTKNKCGGVLISDKYVITAAHCQPGFLASLVAVFGEYDISGDLESRKPVSRNVKRVIVHRKYDAATFENDLALLELESPVKFDAHIIPICLPPDNSDYTKRMATVTGWGRLKYGGGVPSVLQEVQVPIMENHVCQEMFRTAGHSKVILESFLCAGYANGQKDACEGDSGGPLVVQRPDGRYELAGTVSHGIKCAAPYLPGVYMRTTFYKPWITSITGIE